MLNWMGGNIKRPQAYKKYNRHLIKSENGRGGYSQENEYRNYKYNLKCNTMQVLIK